MMKGAPEMARRYTLAEFPDLIRREGGLVDLFMKTTISAGQAPVEIQTEVREINRLHVELDRLMDQIAEICGYDEDEEG